MKASDWVLLREKAALRRGAGMGLWIGCAVGIGLMLIVHVTLASYSRTKHEQAVASIREADRLLMKECESIVVDLGEPVSGTYAEVRDYRREIMRLQGKK